MPIPPQRRPATDTSLGDHEARIRALERSRSAIVERLAFAQIVRTGAAAQNIASGALLLTTTAIQHDTVSYANGVTADIVSVPSRLIIEEDGLYLITIGARWPDYGAGDFGLGISYEPYDLDGFSSPLTISRRVPNQVLYHMGNDVEPFSAGTTLVQNGGQNSGSPIAAPIAWLSACRLGPLP